VRVQFHAYSVSASALADGRASPTLGLRDAGQSEAEPLLAVDSRREIGRQAASQGMWASFFCSGATVLAVFLTHSGMLPFQGILTWRCLTPGRLRCWGWASASMSRIAAVAAMVLYLFERVAAAGKKSVRPDSDRGNDRRGVLLCQRASRNLRVSQFTEAGDSPQSSRV
jgi:hypothetical protein